MRDELAEGFGEAQIPANEETNESEWSLDWKMRLMRRRGKMGPLRMPQSMLVQLQQRIDGRPDLRKMEWQCLTTN